MALLEKGKRFQELLTQIKLIDDQYKSRKVRRRTIFVLLARLLPWKPTFGNDNIGHGCLVKYHRRVCLASSSKVRFTISCVALLEYKTICLQRIRPALSSDVTWTASEAISYSMNRATLCQINLLLTFFIQCTQLKNRPNVFLSTADARNFRYPNYPDCN